MDCNLEAERVHYVQDGDLLALPGNPPKRISMNHIRDIELQYSVAQSSRRILTIVAASK